MIKVHRLLKNEVPIEEYAIFTEAVLPLDKDQENNLTTVYDFGNISFVYNPLEHLQERLPDLDPIPDDIPKHKLFDKTEVIKTPINDLYEVISNFDYRLLWIKGVDKMEYEKNKVNRVGEKHRCLFNKNSDVIQTTVSKTAKSNQLVYGESTTNVPFTKRMNNYFILEETIDGDTRLNIQVFADFMPFGIIMKPLMKKTMKKIITENIKELILLIDSGFMLNQANKE